VISIVMGSLWMPAIHAAELVVIVNPLNTNASITAETVARIYLGKADAFPDQSVVKPIGLASDNPLRQRFDQRVLGRTPGQLRSYWARQIFSGRGGPPRELASSLAVRDYVADNRHAIGYIDAREVNEHVRVVLTIKDN
jgi:ABC-type phosphate transport system substrate-binding protein